MPKTTLKFKTSISSNPKMCYDFRFLYIDDVHVFFFIFSRHNLKQSQLFWNVSTILYMLPWWYTFSFLWRNTLRTRKKNGDVPWSNHTSGDVNPSSSPFCLTSLLGCSMWILRAQSVVSVLSCRPSNFRGKLNYDRPVHDGLFKNTVVIF